MSTVAIISLGLFVFLVLFLALSLCRVGSKCSREEERDAARAQARSRAAVVRGHGSYRREWPVRLSNRDGDLAEIREHRTRNGGAA